VSISQNVTNFIRDFFLEALPLILENNFQMLSAREGKEAMKKDNLYQAPP
jgi:hypothetical protein